VVPVILRWDNSVNKLDPVWITGYVPSVKERFVTLKEFDGIAIGLPEYEYRDLLVLVSNE